MRGRIGFAGILALAAAATALGQGDPWSDTIRRGSAAEIAGDYAAAAAAYREASRLAEAFPPADPRRIFTFNSQGMMHDAMGRFADAEMAFRRALSGMDLAAGTPAGDRATVLANLANVCLEMGQDARAEKLLRESISLHMASPTPHEVRLAIARNSLAEFLTVKGRYNEAGPLIESTLPVLEKHPEAATELGAALNNLAAVRMYLGRFAEALPLLERSLATLEAARGPAHPVLLRTLHNLAAARQRSGQMAAAGVVWRRTVDLAAASVGVEHPLYGEILGNYAAYLRVTGDKAGGKALSARSVEILRDHRRRNGGGVVDVTALQQGAR
jgi:tetratricopeptide (TPR) repeat protein